MTNNEEADDAFVSTILCAGLGSTEVQYDFNNDAMVMWVRGLVHCYSFHCTHIPDSLTDS